MTIWMLEEIQFEMWDDQGLNPPNFGTREQRRGQCSSDHTPCLFQTTITLFYYCITAAAEVTQTALEAETNGEDSGTWKLLLLQTEKLK